MTNSNNNSSDLQNASILLVEDEDSVRMFASRALIKFGYSVTEASDANQALEHLNNDSFNILITDVCMPGISGIELAKSVSQQYKDINIILISGYSEEANRGELVNHPNFNFLPKPFTLDQLTSLVKTILLSSDNN